MRGEHACRHLMTTLCTALALLPLGCPRKHSGHEIEHPMAVVILGGLVTSTLLTRSRAGAVPSLRIRHRQAVDDLPRQAVPGREKTRDSTRMASRGDRCTPRSALGHPRAARNRSPTASAA